MTTASRDTLFNESLAIHHRIVALYPKVAEREALFRPMHLVSPRIPKPRRGGPRGVDTDAVFCALAIRAATTKQSIVLLCEAGHGTSAMALTRVILENAALMAWQRLGPGRERLETYIMFTSVLHERTVETLQHFSEEFGHLFSDDDPVPQSDPSRVSVAEDVFQGHDDTWAWFPDLAKPGKLKRISVAAMFRDLVERDRTIEYEVMYRLGSEVIHTAPFSLSHLLQRVLSQRTFFLEPIHSDDQCLIALALSNIAMLVVLRTVNEYVGLELDSELEAIVEANRAIGDVAIPQEPTI